jgi:hypothetical protein
VKKACAESYHEILVGSKISIAEAQYLLRYFNKTDGRSQHSGRTVAYDEDVGLTVQPRNKISSL